MVDDLEAERLMHKCQVADAAGKAAEEWAWFTALFALLYVELKWDSLVAGFAAAAAIIAFSHYRYGRPSSKAWDNYEKATGTGKYFVLGKRDES